MVYFLSFLFPESFPSESLSLDLRYEKISSTTDEPRSMISSWVGIVIVPEMRPIAMKISKATAAASNPDPTF